MRTLLFTLTMPGNNAWNNKWSGEGRPYTVTRRVDTHKATQLDGESFTHRFGDGWVARVSCAVVNAKQASAAKKLSEGFCGYDWMVNTILVYGEIRNT